MRGAPDVRRVLLHCVGSAGDVLPFVAIARALQARGAAPVIATSAWFAPRIEQAGVPALALGSREDYAGALQRPGLWHPVRGPRALWSLVVDTLPATLQALEGWLDDRQALLVGSTLGLAVRIAADRGHPRTATVHLSPACLLSAQRPVRLPGLPPLDALPLPLRRCVLDLLDRAAQRMLAPPLDAVRRSAGLPALDRRVTAWLHSPRQVIAAFPSWFAPPASDWPAHTRSTGFPAIATGEALAPDLEAFLREGSAPVVVTAGTGYADAGRFLDAALQAARACGARVVLACAFPGAIPARLPPGTMAVAHAPFAALLPRAAALVHHGGIGTMAAAFAAGLPQCISPLAFDQYDNAARVAALGAGLQLPRAGHRRAAWVRAIDRALHDPRVRAGALACASRIASGPPAAEAIADALLAGYDSPA